MKKIHIVILNYEPQFSDGRVVRVKALIAYLASQGRDVCLYSLSNVSRISEKEGFSHVEIKYPGMGMLASAGSVAPKFQLIRRIALVASRLVYPDRYVFGIPAIYRELRERLGRGDVLVLSCPWFSVLLLALFPAVLRKQLNVVLDYRDLWVNNPIFARGMVQRLLATWLENMALKRSSVVTVTTNSAAKYFEDRGAHVIVVSNGISLSDLSKISLVSNRNGDFPSHLRLGYFGNIGNKRDCRDLLRNLINENIELVIYGSLDSAHLAVCGQSYHGKLGRDESLLRASECSFLLLVIRKNENSDFAIPGKVYECILLRKPILIYCPSDAIVLSYLDGLSYPYFHIESETEADLCFCVRQFVMFAETLDYSRLKSHFEVPVREYEFTKLDRLIDA